MRKAEAERAAAAYKSWRTFYTITGKTLPSAQTSPVQLSSSPSPPIFVANHGQQIPSARTTRKRAHQSTALSAGEHAEDGSVAAAEQVGQIKGITPAPSQPPSGLSAPTPTHLPAFPPCALSSTSCQTRPRLASIITAHFQSPSDIL